MRSTPRQIALYRALGLTAPAFAHVPLVITPGGERLAKRTRPATLASLRERGMAPETVVGALAASAGLRPPGRQMPAAALVDGFALKDIARAAGRGRAGLAAGAGGKGQRKHRPGGSFNLCHHRQRRVENRRFPGGNVGRRLGIDDGRQLILVEEVQPSGRGGEHVNHQIAPLELGPANPRPVGDVEIEPQRPVVGLGAASTQWYTL